MTGLRTRGFAVDPQTRGSFVLSANLLPHRWKYPSEETTELARGRVVAARYSRPATRHTH